MRSFLYSKAKGVMKFIREKRVGQLSKPLFQHSTNNMNRSIGEHRISSKHKIFKHLIHFALRARQPKHSFRLWRNRKQMINRRVKQ